MPRLLVVAVLLALGPAPKSAQLSVIRGSVVAQGDDAFRMPGARVELVGGRATADPVFSDGEGRFALGVPVPFTLRITKAGYAPAIVRAQQITGELTVGLTRGAVLTGRVADELGFPVVNALVRARRLNPPDAVPGVVTDITAETDDRGEFRIGSLAAGRYSVNSERRPSSMDLLESLRVLPPEVLAERERARRETPPAKPLSDTVTVDVGAGDEAYAPILHRERAVTPADAPIGGAVTGIVVDRFGEPVDDVTVRLWRLRYANGRQLAEPTAHARRVSDRGEYRLFYVPPARYIVLATSDDRRHAPVFHPDGTAIAGASPIIVARRQELPGVHITVTRARQSRLRGEVRGAAGERLRADVNLIAAGPIGYPPLRIIAEDGAFEFADVAPGEYVVQAHSSRSEELGIRRVLVVEGENEPLTVTMSATATIVGRAVAEDGRPLAPGQRLTAMLEPEYEPTRPVGMGNIDGEGRFELRGLMGPVRVVLTSGAPGYRLSQYRSDRSTPQRSHSTSKAPKTRGTT